MKTIKTLIVDDHFLMVEGYKSVLSYSLVYDVSIVTALNCEQCYYILNRRSDTVLFDLVILDLALPPFPAQGIYSGEQLAPIIRMRLPQTKLVIITSHAEGFKLYDIIKKVNPDGLMVKSDFTADEFLQAFESIIQGSKHYSKTVLKHLKTLGTSEKYLDTYNRLIISYLAQGILTKNLPDYLPLSMSAIDKRKSQIRDWFSLEKGSDEDIIRAAKKFGYI